MRKIRIKYVFLGLLLFIVLGKTTTVNADEAMTNVNGESQGQMRVTGTLGKPQTSESEEEIEEDLPNKEKPEPTTPTGTKELQESKVTHTGHLPRTNEVMTTPALGIMGMMIVLITGQLIVLFNKREEI